MIQKKGKKVYNFGFTLVEMMVSVSIFAMIVVIGIGSLMSVMDSYRQSQRNKKVTDSLDYILENMTREIRLGKNYYFQADGNRSGEYQDGSAVIDEGDILGFDASDNRGYMRYFLRGGRICRVDYTEDDTYVSCLNEKGQVKITRVRVSVMNTEKNDLKQPLVWLQIEGVNPNEKSEKEKNFVVQTLVSQRELDVEE